MLKNVDVVVGLRDLRAPFSTHHPQIKQWIGSRGHVLVLNRKDQVSPPAAKDWKAFLEATGAKPILVDAQKGDGINDLKEAILLEGKDVNKKRGGRGLKPRAIRVAVLGFPNIGKSALINRLV